MSTENLEREAATQLLFVLLRDACTAGQISEAIDRLAPGECILSKVGEARRALAEALFDEAVRAVTL